MKFIIIVLFLYLIVFVKSQWNQLPEDQNNAAIDLIQNFYNTTTLDLNQTPCMVFVCVNSGNNQLTISEISFDGSPVAVPKVLHTNFAVFINVTKIKLPAGLYPKNIIDNLTNLTQLTSLEIGSYNSTYNDNNLVLPASLESITISSTSSQFGVNFFKSKTLKKLIILDCTVGFQLPSSFPEDFPTMDALEQFITPVIYGSNFPSNFGSIATSLVFLQLNVINNKQYTQYFDFPTLSQFPSLTRLLISFKVLVFGVFNPPLYHTWAFPSILTNISPLLDNLAIEGPGFVKTTDNNGNIDFSNYKEGFFLSYTGFYVGGILIEDGCKFISTCTSKSCLVFPKKSALTISGCPIDLNKLDLQNIEQIIVSGNSLEQTLPDSLVYEQMKGMKFIGSNFTGPLPESLCNFPVNQNTFNISNNNFNGKILSCFSCRGPKGIEDIMFPNKWDDFNSTSLPTSCPTKLLNDTNVIAQTDSTSVITLSGKDFGWTANNNKFNIIVPNKLMTVTLDIGVGKNHTVSTTFDNSQDYTLTYNYEKPVISSYEYNFETQVFTLFGDGFDYTQNMNFVTFNNDDQKVFYSSKAVKSNGKDKIEGENLSYIFGSYIKRGDVFNVTIKVGDQVSDSVTFTFSESGSMGSSDFLSSEENSTPNSSSKLLISKLLLLIIVAVLL